MKIISSSPWIRTGIAPLNPYIGNNGAAAGMMRYNINSQTIEIFDGSSWIAQAQQTQEISTTGEMDTILNWARKKMAEEREIEQLAAEHPAVNAAYENFKKSADQLKTTIILSKDDHTTN